MDDTILRPPQKVRSERTQKALYDAACTLMHDYGVLSSFSQQG